MKANLQSFADEISALRKASSGSPGRFPKALRARVVAAYQAQQELDYSKFSKQIGISPSALRVWVSRSRVTSASADVPVRVMTSGTQIPAVSQQLGEVTPSITVSIAGIVIIFPSATPIPELVHFIRLIKEQVQ